MLQDIPWDGTELASPLTLPGALLAPSYVEQTQIVKPTNPPAGKMRFYPKADGQYYKLDSAGVETIMSGLTQAQLDARYVQLTAVDPFPVYLTKAEGDGYYDALGAVATHTAAADPHPQYLTPVEGDARYAVIPGGGSGGYLTVSAADATYLKLTGGTLTGSLYFSADNTYDIGASGATRPRDLFVGRNAVVNGTAKLVGVVSYGSDATPPISRATQFSPRDLSHEAPAGYSMFSGRDGTNACANLYWDGSNYMRYNIVQNSTMWGLGPNNGFTIYSVAAGANPATVLNTLFSVNNAGVLTVAGTGKIQGDWSNATISNRTLFQSSVANGDTAPMLVPNGTSRTSGWYVFNTANPLNSAYAALAISNTSANLFSSVTGTGTQVPLVINTPTERARFDTTSSNVQGPLDLRLNVNAYYDGTNWNRFDTSNPLAHINVGVGTINFYNAPAGSGSPAWVHRFGIDASGNVSGASIGAGAGQIAAGNHTHSYLPTTGGGISGRLQVVYTDNQGIAYTGGSGGQLEVQSSGGAAMIAFHRAGAFAAYFGVDTDNQWAVGGWSMGGARYVLITDSQSQNVYNKTLNNSLWKWPYTVIGNGGYASYGYFCVINTPSGNYYMPVSSGHQGETIIVKNWAGGDCYLYTTGGSVFGFGGALGAPTGLTLRYGDSFTFISDGGGGWMIV
jgi:hypothetical protein